MSLRGAITTVILSAAVATVAAAPAHGSDRYAVGSKTYTLVDKTRGTDANGTYPGAATRTLSTLLLYPAKGTRGAPAVKNARAVRTKSGFPLIVFSHGFTANGPAYQYLLERYVRQGYVVAAPTFPLSSGGAPGGPKLTDYVNQPADVSFVLTRVLALQKRGRGAPTMIDRDHVAAAGHSLGAITTLGLARNTCCRDRRIDAAIAFSGIQLPFKTGSFTSPAKLPLMLVHGDSDGVVPVGGSTAAFDAAPGPKALLTLQRAPHVPFVAPWLAPTVKATTDFFDGYLKGDRRALRRLTRDGTVPGVSTVRTASLDR